MRDLSFCRSSFPSLEVHVNGNPAAYLDGPGGTQVPHQVIGAISDYYLHMNANTHGQFVTSNSTDAVVERARDAMAALLGAASSSQISFGANMTTLNFALSRAIARTIQPGDEVVVTELDHDANVAPWLALKEHGAVIRTVRVNEDGTLNMEHLQSLLHEGTRLVAVGYASNALGTVNDVYTIRRWTREIGALLVVDAVHFAPHAPIDVELLDPDFLLCSAYKFFGPHVGILYSKTGALDALRTDKVRPQSQSAPEKIETGTLNFAALNGVVAAVEFIASLAISGGTLRERLVSAMKDVYDYEHQLVHHLYEGLSAFPGLKLYGPPVNDSLRAPTVSFTLEGFSPMQVAKFLGEQGVFVWDGDFYALNIVNRLGLAQTGGLVRIGLAPYNTLDEIQRVFAGISALLEQHSN